MFLASFRVLLPSEYSVPSDGNLQDAIVSVSYKQTLGPALLTQDKVGCKPVSLVTPQLDLLTQPWVQPLPGPRWGGALSVFWVCFC